MSFLIGLDFLFPTSIVPHFLPPPSPRPYH